LLKKFVGGVRRSVVGRGSEKIRQNMKNEWQHKESPALKAFSMLLRYAIIFKLDNAADRASTLNRLWYEWKSIY
jgi:hypothetical protein